MPAMFIRRFSFFIRLFSLAALCGIISCTRVDGEYLTLINNTDERIVFAMTVNEDYASDPYCLIPTNKMEFNEFIHTYVILPHSSLSMWFCTDPNWVNLNGESDTFYFYLFSFDDILYMPCEEFKSLFPVKHAWKVTFKDLSNCNWTLVYPPEGSQREWK